LTCDLRPFSFEEILNSLCLFSWNSSIGSFAAQSFSQGRGDVVNFDKGEPVPLDPADVASILKKYLRDLPDSLFTRPMEDTFRGIMAIPDGAHPRPLASVMMVF